MTSKKTIFILGYLCLLQTSALLLSGCVKQNHVYQMWQWDSTKHMQSSLWKEVTVSRPSYHNSGVMDFSGIKRADGFTLFRTGIGREFQEYFQCTGNFEDFKFTASRWDEGKNAPTDTYMIYISQPSNGLINKAIIADAIILSHAKDIESALLNIHPDHTKIFGTHPVKRVLFHISDLSQKSYRVVSADEL